MGIRVNYSVTSTLNALIQPPAQPAQPILPQRPPQRRNINLGNINAPSKDSLSSSSDESSDESRGWAKRGGRKNRQNLTNKL